MKIRLLSGSCYVAILALFFCLKIFLPSPYGTFAFDALIYAFTLLGTFEMLRAVKEKTTKAERVLVFTFALVSIPACAVCEYFFGNGLLVTGVCFLVMALALLSERRWANYLATGLCIALQLGYLYCYIAGYPVY